MLYFVTVDGQEVEVDLRGEVALVAGAPVESDLRSVGIPGRYSLTLDDRSVVVDAERTEEGDWVLSMEGHRLQVSAQDERSRAIQLLAGARGAKVGPTHLKAPMPGLVIKVEVSVGDQVAVGQGLVVIEAMKMENELRAEAPGRVRKVNVEAGEPVERNTVLVEFDAIEDPASGDEG